MTDTDLLIDEPECGPFPTALEMLEQQCALLATELDDTNAELRACRQRIAVLVVQHGNDANELARQRTELVRLGWELSTARVDASREGAADGTSDRHCHGTRE
jgi:hypothetical protein